MVTAVFLLSVLPISDFIDSRYVWPDDFTISRQHLRVHCILFEQNPIAKVPPLVYATDLSFNGTFLKKRYLPDTISPVSEFLMGKNCTYLLDDGDELRLSESVILTYHSLIHMDHTGFSAIQEREKAVFASRYHISRRLLGQGGNGKVLTGTNQATQQQLACKVIKLNYRRQATTIRSLRNHSDKQTTNTTIQSKQWPTTIATCFREFTILKDLSHPNIVTLEKVFWSCNTIYIFQDLVTGGDLFSYVEYMDGRLTDVQAAVIVLQILKGVEYLHDRDIVHRDIKPDNILMTSLEVGARVVISDFGNARLLPNSTDMTKTEKVQRMFSYVGTLEFQAPEINSVNRTIPAGEGYSKSIDMWSIGSVTAMILTGDYIFSDRAHPLYEDDPRAVIVKLAASCDLSVLDEPYHPLWGRVGPRAKHFIRSLLVLEEDARMTASEALAHPWFANESHAHDYEDLYQRSIQSWKPRQQNVELVERLPEFRSLKFTDCASNQESVSCFFEPSQLGPKSSIPQKRSISQCLRGHSSFPFATEDHKRLLFASEAAAPTSQINGLNGHNRQDYDYSGYSQGDWQIYSPESQDSMPSPRSMKANFRSALCVMEAEQFNRNSASSPALGDEDVSVEGLRREVEYYDNEDYDGFEESQLSNDESYQHGLTHTEQARATNGTQESPIVRETPSCGANSPRR